jgi:hypothetical protein
MASLLKPLKSCSHIPLGEKEPKNSGFSRLLLQLHAPLPLVLHEITLFATWESRRTPSYYLRPLPYDVTHRRARERVLLLATSLCYFLFFFFYFIYNLLTF